MGCLSVNKKQWKHQSDSRISNITWLSFSIPGIWNLAWKTLSRVTDQQITHFLYLGKPNQPAIPPPPIFGPVNSAAVAYQAKQNNATDRHERAKTTDQNVDKPAVNPFSKAAKGTKSDNLALSIFFADFLRTLSHAGVIFVFCIFQPMDTFTIVHYLLFLQAQFLMDL